MLQKMKHAGWWRGKSSARLASHMGLTLFATVCFACSPLMSACSSKGDHILDMHVTHMDFDQDQNAFIIYIDNRAFKIKPGRNIGTVKMEVYEDSIAKDRQKVIEANISVTATKLRGCNDDQTKCDTVDPSQVTITSPQFQLKDDGEDDTFTLYELLADEDLNKRRAVLSLQFEGEKIIEFEASDLQFVADIFAGGFGYDSYPSYYSRNRSTEPYRKLAGFYDVRAVDMGRNSREGDEFGYLLEEFFKTLPPK